MDDMLKDSRFAHISHDPRFRRIPKRERKVRIDKRFQSMFKDKQFRVDYTVDKRGRPVSATSREDLKKYYELSSSEEEAEDVPHTVDYARGEVLLTDSSSDEDSDEAGSTEEEEDLQHGWGELDRDAERTDEITHRLALCHMDWDRIRAVDLMVLFSSFLPQGGHILSISIYPSEFGMKRMQEEEVRGPIELVDNNHADEDQDEESDAYNMEKLRQYQLNRLKYYYAVLVCDSAVTANKIYTECDGLEYESSATRLDLRFIPDDTAFEQEPSEVCDKMPDAAKYQPRYFTTTALQQVKVDLTWDETDPDRQEISQKLSTGQVDGISEADLRDYLATSSEDDADEDDHPGDGDDTSGDPVSKYQLLLREIEQEEEKKKSSDVGLEITWGVGLKDKTKKLVEEKLKQKNKLTPFEQYVEKKKEKKKQKKKREHEELSDDSIPSDVDMNDSYFQEEFAGEFKKKEKPDETEEVKSDQAELELLLMRDAEEKNHFSLKAIQEQQAVGKKKRNKKKIKKSVVEDDFQVDVKDERFAALYSSHLFNIDPTDPHYHKTKGMEALRAEKLKHRQGEGSVDRGHRDPELSALVKSVKRKTQQNRHS